MLTIEKIDKAVRRLQKDGYKVNKLYVGDAEAYDLACAMHEWRTSESRYQPHTVTEFLAWIKRGDLSLFTLKVVYWPRPSMLKFGVADNGSARFKAYRKKFPMEFHGFGPF